MKSKFVTFNTMCMEKQKILKIATIEEWNQKNPETSVAELLRKNPDYFIDNDKNGVRSIYEGWKTKYHPCNT